MGCGSEVAGKTPSQERIYVTGEKEHGQQGMVQARGIPVNRNLLRDLRTVTPDTPARTIWFSKGGGAQRQQAGRRSVKVRSEKLA
jgi:hypothetical protein